MWQANGGYATKWQVCHHLSTLILQQWCKHTARSHAYAFNLLKS